MRLAWILPFLFIASVLSETFLDTSLVAQFSFFLGLSAFAGIYENFHFSGELDDRIKVAKDDATKQGTSEEVLKRLEVLPHSWSDREVYLFLASAIALIAYAFVISSPDAIPFQFNEWAIFLIGLGMYSFGWLHTLILYHFRKNPTSRTPFMVARGFDFGVRFSSLSFIVLFDALLVFTYAFVLLESLAETLSGIALTPKSIAVMGTFALGIFGGVGLTFAILPFTHRFKTKTVLIFALLFFLPILLTVAITYFGVK